MDIEDESGVWYTDADNRYRMTDPVTEGKWIIISDRDEDQESLNELLNFHLSNGMERPSEGTANNMIRTPTD